MALDLFAGVGGLSLGLRNAGFRVAGAVELDAEAFSTYKANHPETAGLNQDIRTVKGKALLRACGTTDVDLLAGCPPCQGFSSLTAQWRRWDERNDLVGEFSRLLVEIKPRAVMMENVPRLASTGREVFQRLLDTLRANGYESEWRIVDVADYGVPQHRKRLVLTAGRGFRIPIPEPTHSQNGLNGRKRWQTVRDAIGAMDPPVHLDEAHRRGGPGAVNWHVTRRLSPRNQARLRAAKPGGSWTSIPKRLRPKCHQEKNVGFKNVYGRLLWDEPSSTITGGCTTLSKGRFGHPVDIRTLSVREAATLQSFPNDYLFDCDKIDRVCEMIGNALPVSFAEIMAAACKEALRANPD